jgi:hypothetical protein
MMMGAVPRGPTATTTTTVPTIKPTAATFKLECLYTNQVNKKRKTWSDGFLKVAIDGGIYHCTLLDADDVREIGLESRPLEPSEIARFQKRIDHHLKMDQYIVDVSFASMTTPSTSAPVEANKAVPKLSLPKKFVPPSKYIPPPKIDQNNPHNTLHAGSTSTSALSTNSMYPTSSSSLNASSKFKKYDVMQDELDAIWGDEGAAKTDNRTNYTQEPSRKQNNWSFHTENEISRQSDSRPTTVTSSSYQNGISNRGQSRASLFPSSVSNDYDDTPNRPEDHWNEEPDIAPNHSTTQNRYGVTAPMTKKAKRNEEGEDDYVQLNAPNRHVATLARTTPHASSSSSSAPSQYNSVHDGFNTQKRSAPHQQPPSKQFIPPSNTVQRPNQPISMLSSRQQQTAPPQQSNDFDEYNITDDIWNS